MVRLDLSTLRDRIDAAGIRNRFRVLGWDPFAIFRHYPLSEELDSIPKEDAPNYKVRRLFRDNLNIRVADLGVTKDHAEASIDIGEE